MKIKKFVTIFLSVLLVILISVLNVSAVPATMYTGNVDGEGKITVKDATLIQKNIAGLVSLSKIQMAIADVDGDKDVTVKDATMIQKRCANIINSFTVQFVPYNLVISSFNANYDSGKAMVGAPVTFTVSAYDERNATTYEYFINGEAAGEVTTNNTFTCTFDEAGIYKVKVTATNDLGFGSSATLDYEVVEAYSSDTVKMKAFYYDRNQEIIYKGDQNIVFTAEAMFGSGEYEYAFYISGELVQDFSPKNTYTVEVFDRAKYYSMYVKVRDAVTGDKDGEVMLIEVNDGSIIG